MLIVGDITWHAENVAFYIKRMHQLQKKVENAILDLDKEAENTAPYGVTNKFGVEDPNLLEVIDQISHANEEETLSIAADHMARLNKFHTHDRYSAQRANLTHISLTLDWYSTIALSVLYCILEQREKKGDATTYYSLKDLEEVMLEILDRCEKAYITSWAPAPVLTPELDSKLRSAIRRG